MSDNPYQSPQATEPAVGVLSGARSDLRKVAEYQKGILICILVYLVGVLVQMAMPPGTLPIGALMGLGAGLVGAVFVFLLAMKLYGALGGGLLGLLTLVPLIGVFVLLVINGKATNVLRQNGIQVGLLGAKTSDL